MSAIGPGSKVRCIKIGPWQLISGPPGSGRNPQYGEVCTVTRLDHEHAFGVGLFLAGFDPHDSFAAIHFRPLDGIDDLAELIREARNPDAPAHEREREREFVVVR